MDPSLSIEEITLLLQWQYPALPHELWLIIVQLRLSFLPQNHPVFLHLIASVKRAWRAHFHCLELHHNLVMFLPDARIKLNKPVLAHIAWRYKTQCYYGHWTCGLQISFTGRKRDEKRMLQRTQNVLLTDPLRDFVYDWTVSAYETHHAMSMEMAIHNALPVVDSVPRTYRPLRCTTCYPSPPSIIWFTYTLPSAHFPNKRV